MAGRSWITCAPGHGSYFAKAGPARFKTSGDVLVTGNGDIPHSQAVRGGSRYFALLLTDRNMNLVLGLMQGC